MRAVGMFVLSTLVINESAKEDRRTEIENTIIPSKLRVEVMGKTEGEGNQRGDILKY